MSEGTISFRIVDIVSDDLPDDQNEKHFIITLYGIDQNNDRVVVHVKKYYPYFYIKIPNTWDGKDGESLIKDICGLKPIDNPEQHLIFSNLKTTELCFHKEFYGLQWDIINENIQIFNFLKISMKTHDSMKKLISLIRKHYNLKEKDYHKITETAKERLGQWRNTPTAVDCDSNLYESSIHPIIRFIHDTDIKPTGWISIKTIDEKTNLFPSVKHEYFTNINDILSLDKNDLSNYRIASFDIECDSLHGDFPQAKKDFKKLSSDIFDSYQNIIKNISENRRIEFNKNIQNNIINLLKSGFTGIFNTNGIWRHSNMNKIKIIQDELPSDEIYDTIMNLIKDTDIFQNVQNIYLKGKDRDKSINELQDIIQTECDKILLKVEGDPIIQIGTVFYDYETGKTYRHIVVIGNEDNLLDSEICDQIDGIDVQCCKTEKDLLLRWKDIIKKKDPDFITGYNIFGFDFKYIYDRAEILFPCHHRCKVPWWHSKGCPMKEFLNLGKIDTSIFQAKDHKSKKCDIRKQNISSSALGDNTLHYITMDGRILFDIQKEVQKAHNLESYKLDNVASHFMRGKLKSINDHDIIVSDTGNLKDHDFISFRTHRKNSYNGIS